MMLAEGGEKRIPVALQCIGRPKRISWPHVEAVFVNGTSHVTGGWNDVISPIFLLSIGLNSPKRTHQGLRNKLPLMSP